MAERTIRDFSNVLLNQRDELLQNTISDDKMNRPQLGDLQISLDEACNMIILMQEEESQRQIYFEKLSVIENQLHNALKIVKTNYSLNSENLNSSNILEKEYDDSHDKMELDDSGTLTPRLIHDYFSPRFSEKSPISMSSSLHDGNKENIRNQNFYNMNAKPSNFDTYTLPNDSKTNLTTLTSDVMYNDIESIPSDLNGENELDGDILLNKLSKTVQQAIEIFLKIQSKDIKTNTDLIELKDHNRKMESDFLNLKKCLFESQIKEFYLKYLVSGNDASMNEKSHIKLYVPNLTTIYTSIIQSVFEAMSFLFVSHDSSNKNLFNIERKEIEQSDVHTSSTSDISIDVTFDSDKNINASPTFNNTTFDSSTSTINNTTNPIFTFGKEVSWQQIKQKIDITCPSTTPKKADKELEGPETIEKENQIENDMSLTVLAQLIATINIHQNKNIYHNDLMSDVPSTSNCHNNKCSSSSSTSSSSSSYSSSEKHSISFQNATKSVKQFTNKTLCSLHTLSLSHVLLSFIQILQKWGNHLLTTTIEQLIQLKHITSNSGDISNTNPLPIQ